MTYFGVLARFILPPLLVLVVLSLRDVRQHARSGRLAYAAVLLHVLIAVAYTTPWDNYLVATGVWWYDLELVTGIRLGWVPIEEYTFFVVQTLLTGLWLVSLRRWFFASSPEVRPSMRVRLGATAAIGALWLVSVGMLVAGWQPGRYLALILVWALPPMMLQTLFGADILLARWRLLAAAIIPPTLYLWLVDALAIQSGTWTISPAMTTGLKLGPLPIEEMTFFLVTNVMVSFGITLILSPAGEGRLSEIRNWLGGRRLAVQRQTVEEQRRP